MVFKELKVFRVDKVYKVLREVRGFKVLEDHLVHRGSKVFKVVLKLDLP
jgi:hypothetical protein